MPVDVNPIQNAVGVQFLPARNAAEPVGRELPKSVRQDDAGVAVEAGPSFAGDTPPMDVERVEEIRRALEDGSYPVVPTRIADAMIAARLMLSVSE